MDPSGHVQFGVYPGSTKSIASSKAFNDGQWHYVVASLSSQGMALYVDAKKVASNPDVTYGQPYWGYWRIGGDNSWNGNPYFAGSIDEVAIYPAPLSPEQIVEHYTLSGRTVTTPPAPADSYGAAIYAQDPVLYWRLGEASGTTAVDSGQQETPGLYSGDVTLGAASGISGTTNTSADFTSGVVASAVQFDNPTTYTTEIWFNTTTNQGGKLTGFGRQQTGTSSSYDRHVYMQDDGHLVFGTWTGQTNTISTPLAYNDGAWHQVVASQSMWMVNSWAQTRRRARRTTRATGARVATIPGVHQRRGSMACSTSSRSTTRHSPPRRFSRTSTSARPPSPISRQPPRSMRPQRA
jgi:large repetitive protein